MQEYAETLDNLPGEEPPVDDLDSRVIELFAAEPRIGVLQASRRLGVARGTVQARLDRLATTGVVTGWARTSPPSRSASR